MLVVGCWLWVPAQVTNSILYANAPALEEIAGKVAIGSKAWKK
jgi:hypothetical protein